MRSGSRRYGAARSQHGLAVEVGQRHGLPVRLLSGPDVTAAQLATGYLPADVVRLAAVKRAVDPGDVFRTHHGRADAAQRAATS